MQRFILSTLLVTALCAGCGPSAESVITKNRVAAREKIDLMRALAQAKESCRQMPGAPATPLVFADEDEAPEKRGRVNAIAVHAEDYQTGRSAWRDEPFRIVMTPRVISDAETLLVAGSLSNGKKPSGREAQAVFESLARVRYVAFIFDSDAEPVSVDVPRAVLSGSRVVEGATAKANAPGSFDAAVCVLDLETRQVVTLMRRLKAASLGVLAAADEEKGPELLARAARFELFLRLQEKLKGTTVPCLRAKRAGTTIDLCKPGEPAGLPLIRVNKQDCAVSDGRCSQYVDTAGRLVLAGPYALGTEFSEGVALTGGQGRCALIDRMGQERCQLECVDIRDASEGLFRVQAADETWRYVDAQCKAVLGPFEDAEPFREGLAKVRYADGRTRVINRQGMPVLLPGVDRIFPFRHGFARVWEHRAEELFGFMTPEGTPAFGGRVFRAAEDFSEGLAYVEEGERKGYIDTTGQLVVSLGAEVTSAGPFRQGLARIHRGATETQYIDKTGKVVFTLEGNHTGDFSEGLVPLCRPAEDGTPDCRHGVVDLTGQRMGMPVEGSLGRYSEGLATHAVVRDEVRRIGYVDRTFKTVIEPAFKDAKEFSEGLAAVQTHEGWGFIDKTGAWVIPARYATATSFLGGFACVLGMGDGVGTHLIDAKGQRWPALPEGWACTEGFSEGKTVLHRAGRGFGLLMVDTTGKQVMGFSTGLHFMASERRLLTELGDEFGFADEKGRLVIPVAYDKAEPFQNGAAVVTEGRESFFIGPDGKPLTGKRYAAAGAYSEGLAPVARGKWVDYKQRVIIMGSGGREQGSRIEPAQPFCDCRYAFVDKQGQEKSGYDFTFAEPFTQGLAAVSFGSCTLDKVPAHPGVRQPNCPKLFGYIGTDMHLVIAPAFDVFAPEAFKDGVAREGARLIDREGNQVWSDTDW